MTNIDRITPTKTIARKGVKLLAAGLCAGKGTRARDEMCLLALTRFTFGLPHGDTLEGGLPVGTAVRSIDIYLNDSVWSSNMARAKGLRRLFVSQIGSDELDQVEFETRLTLKTIQQLCPKLFREFSKLCKTDAEKLGMEAAANDCEQAIELTSAVDLLKKDLDLARALARDLTLDHDLDLALDRARAHDLDLARALALALDHALDLALALARARALDLAFDLDFDLDLALARARARDLAFDLDFDLDLARPRDEALTLMAEIAVEVLVEMKCQGTKWLDVCEQQ